MVGEAGSSSHGPGVVDVVGDQASGDNEVNLVSMARSGVHPHCLELVLLLVMIS